MIERILGLPALRPEGDVVRWDGEPMTDAEKIAYRRKELKRRMTNKRRRERRAAKRAQA